MVTLDDAKRVIAAAEQKAQEIGQPMNIAVVDAGGNLVAHVRMDKAWIGSVDIAIKKAWTARAFDISTKELAELSQSGDQFFGIHASNQGRVMIFAGGDAVRGAAAIAKYGCGSCHTIGGISGATGMVGPPLIGLRNRMYVAGMLPNNSTNLARWISNPKLVNPGTVMPVLGVGPSEATDIAAYIYSMK